MAYLGARQAREGRDTQGPSEGWLNEPDKGETYHGAPMQPLKHYRLVIRDGSAIMGYSALPNVFDLAAYKADWLVHYGAAALVGAWALAMQARLAARRGGPSGAPAAPRGGGGGGRLMQESYADKTARMSAARAAGNKSTGRSYRLPNQW